MATDSILHNIIIDNEEKAKCFIEALEQSKENEKALINGNELYCDAIISEKELY